MWLRLLRDAPLWEPLALKEYPVVRSIVAALAATRPPDFRILYRTHWEHQHKPKPRLKTTLDDYLITIELLSYGKVIGTSSCSVDGLVEEEEEDKVTTLHMPPMWSKETTPSFLLPPEVDEWDSARLLVRAVVTQLSDLQPLQLYESAETDGGENMTGFGLETVPWLDPDGTTFGDLYLLVELIDDVGVLRLQFQRLDHESDRTAIRRVDVLRYLECLAPWR